MSRPVQIAALDAALIDAVAKVDPADQAVRDWLDKHGALLDEWDDLARARADAYRDVRAIEDAIRRLGYVVLGASKDTSILGDRKYDATKDRDEARERRENGGAS